MKRLLMLMALLGTLGMHLSAHAGLFSTCGADKSCGAAKTPGCGADKSACKCDACACDSCGKTVSKPCQPQVFNYQRKISTSPPPVQCGANDCAPDCAAPSAGPAPAGDPADVSCAAPEEEADGDEPAACAPASGAGCGATACCNGGCCADDACAIAELIFASQTECYARNRAKAIDRLGDKYSCVCHPEIMAAFTYSLNDTDERVRAEAADEIGDQARKYGCCCINERVVEALTMALADCDLGVRRQAAEALRVCGYCIENNCCTAASDAACGADAPACGAESGPACGAESAPACGASGTEAPACGATGTTAPACGAAGTVAPAASGDAPAGDGEGGGELSPSAVDQPQPPAAAPAPPAEKVAPPAETPAKPEYDEKTDKAAPAAPPQADDKTANTLKRRSVLSRLFNMIRR